MAQNGLDLTKEQMHVVVVGHVDHGKSTIIGRLLADTNSLPKGKLEAIREKTLKSGRPFEFAYLIDALKDEQAQSITIDSARVFFQSNERNYIIIDAPGHIEFIKNMVTGASHAEAAILVIDAEEGVQENSRRHGYLLGMLGIKKIVVVVNKMDLVDYSQAVFKAIVDEYSHYLSDLGIQPMYYIPVSGREGDGVVKPSERLAWHTGPTVLDALDLFTKEKPLVDLPLRIPVQDVYKFNNFGDNRRIVAGNIASGQIKVGDEMVFYPSGKRTKVKTIESFNIPKVATSVTGQAVGFTMLEQIYVNRGQIATRVQDTPPFVSSRLRASIFWLGKQPLSLGKDYIFKLGTSHEKVQVEAIHKVIDASDYKNQNDRTEIGHHDVAEVTFKLAHPIAFDTSEVFPETSRFVLVDDYEIRGGGIVLEALTDDDAALREDVYTRNMKWIPSDVTMSHRAEMYNQRPSVVVITGTRHAGRKTLARKLEKQLFKDGKFVYYLGIGSLLYGVNADLKRHEAEGGWREHVRRFAEVSHLFLDAGMLLIVTAIEFTQDDLDILETVIDKDMVHVVWVGGKVTTDIEFDIQLKNRESLDEGVVMVKHLLQKRGILFTP
jgi:bifunctional enzyme CysN/CysC